MTIDALTDDVIADITRTMWAAIVDDSHDLEDATSSGEGDLTASVKIAGTWNGTFFITLSAAAARQAAARMFACDGAGLSDADIRDAAGEIINIIGGNLKALLPPPVTLSLPHVAHGGAHALEGADVLSDMHFAWLDEPIIVAVRRGRREP